MRDLSIIIPARNEEFLPETIEDALKNIRGDTEVIAICDGAWPIKPIKDSPRLVIVYNSTPAGQRQSTNEGVRLSNSKYIMKVDAHCKFDEGFDTKLMESCEPDWMAVPGMYRFHVFDWVCKECGGKVYQDKPPVCPSCGGKNMEKRMVWRRRGRPAHYMWFDPDLRFRYFDRNALKEFTKDPDAKRKYHHRYRDWAQGDVTDQMTCIGACWLMERKRYWEIEGLDEGHGSWGQMGTELACKNWLSGGRQVINKKTWFAHMFRTTESLKFPFPLSGREIEKARKYSRKMWLGNRWKKARRPLSWMIEKFGPLPGWDKT